MISKSTMKIVIFVLLLLSIIISAFITVDGTANDIPYSIILCFSIAFVISSFTITICYIREVLINEHYNKILSEMEVKK